MIMDVNAFIAEVRKREPLWNRKNICPNKQEREAANVLWDEVAAACNVSKEKARSKWRSLRDTFVKMLKAAAKNGTEASNWVHFESLSFLLEKNRCPPHPKYFYPPKGAIEKQTSSPQAPPTIISLAPSEETFPIIDEVYTLSHDSDENSIREEEQQSLNNTTSPTNQFAFVDGPPPLVMIEPQRTSTSFTSIKRVYTLQDEESDDLNLSEEQQYTCPTKKPALESDMTTKELQPSNETSADDNENLSFFRSLLPFMNRLDAVQQLRTRMRFQEILLDEFRT